jgi:hypothetical protein
MKFVAKKLNKYAGKQYHNFYFFGNSFVARCHNLLYDVFVITVKKS